MGLITPGLGKNPITGGLGGNTGICIVCRKKKNNITKHHVKELDDRVVSVCRDCHDVIEWWHRELERMRNES